MKYNTKVINMFGGPGAGKSVAAMELTARLKRAGKTAEYVTEVAKDLVHEDTTVLYRYQDWISAEQNRRQGRLIGQYEYIVTDSPLLLGIFYCPPNYYPSFKQLILEKFWSYDNINFYLHRNSPYEAIGRYQDENGAKRLDLQIQSYLRHNGIQFQNITSDDNIGQNLMDAMFPPAPVIVPPRFKPEHVAAARNICASSTIERPWPFPEPAKFKSNDGA
jgi:hypothetical protein